MLRHGTTLRIQRLLANTLVENFHTVQPRAHEYRWRRAVH